MNRTHAPIEFGFPTAPYIPPEHRRPLWKTLLFGALLSIVPIVGPSIGAVYVDRRDAPGTYEAPAALKTAFIQLVAIAVLIVLLWLVLGLVFGISVQFNPRLTKSM
jgi:predicted cobalt transporter CbtA